MDVLIVRQRPIRGDSKVIAVGPWGDIKDDITEPRRYGARWEHVIIALVTSVKVAPWDKETERNLKAKTIKGRFIVKIELPGFSFRDGYQQSAKDDGVANDGRKIYNQPFKYDGGKNYLNPQPKNNPDHYYPRFHFLRYEDMKEEIADPLFEAAKDGFQQFWNGYFIPHIEYTKKQLEGGEYEDPDEDTDNEETPDDIPEAFQTKAERKKTKTEKKVEEKRRRAAGKKNFEKVETEKDPEAALQAALESAGIKTDDLDPELIATLKARASKNKQVDDDLVDSTDDDLEESDDALGDEEFDDLEF